MTEWKQLKLPKFTTRIKDMINTDKVLKFNNSFTLLWSERAINVQCNYYWIKTPSVSIINANNCTESVSSMRECTWTSKRQVSSLRPHMHCFQIYMRWMHIVPKTRYRIKTAVYLWSATWISLRSFARPRFETPQRLQCILNIPRSVGITRRCLVAMHECHAWIFKSNHN